MCWETDKLQKFENQFDLVAPKESKQGVGAKKISAECKNKFETKPQQQKNYWIGQFY